jgi:outer membrane protein TolC
LEQADRVLETETKNVQTAGETLEGAKANLAAGLGTQLDVLQAASDVTRTQTTRLSAIYLHDVGLARLAHACASRPEAFEFDSKMNSLQEKPVENRTRPQTSDVARPPAKLNKQ